MAALTIRSSATATTSGRYRRSTWSNAHSTSASAGHGARPAGDWSWVLRESASSAESLPDHRLGLQTKDSASQVLPGHAAVRSGHSRGTAVGLPTSAGFRPVARSSSTVRLHPGSTDRVPVSEGATNAASGQVKKTADGDQKDPVKAEGIGARFVRAPTRSRR